MHNFECSTTSISLKLVAIEVNSQVPLTSDVVSESR